MITIKQLLNNLISFNTISDRSNLTLISFVEYHLKQAGFKTSQFNKNGKANLFAWKNDKNRIIFAAHTDTVPASVGWKTNPFELTENEKCYIGLGVSDMKGFIAASLSFAGANPDNQRLAFLFTFNEETDFEGAKSLPKNWLRPNDTIILGEPTDNNLMFGHKGLYHCTIKFTGKGGHSSEPRLGVSAISAAARFVVYFESNFQSKVNSRNELFSNPDATYNFGMINGGDAANKIPENVTLSLDVRMTYSEQRKKIDDFILSFQSETRTIISIEDQETASPFYSGNHLYKALKKTGIPVISGASYTTEASFFQNYTDNIVIFGPGDISFAHQIDELISKQKLAQYSKLLDKLVNAL